MPQDITMTDDRAIERSIIDWRSAEIEISFERDWLGLPASDTHPSHLQLRVLADAPAALPITETGYLSHFVSAATVDAAGGPAAYFTAWLDAAANGRSWRQREAAARQLSLFGPSQAA